MDWGKLDLAADRWTAFIETWEFQEEDLTDATFAMQVRLIKDASGAPLVDLATVVSSSSEGVRLIYGGTDTVANHITAGRIDAAPDGYEATDSLALSLLGVRINETTMEGLPLPAERGDDLNLEWDLHITPSGGLKQKYLGGTFTVRAGATE